MALARQGMLPNPVLLPHNAHASARTAAILPKQGTPTAHDHDQEFAIGLRPREPHPPIDHAWKQSTMDITAGGHRGSHVAAGS